MPIIRNYVKDSSDFYKETVINKNLGKSLGVFLAKVEVKTNGNTGIDYVLKKDIGSYSKTEKELFIIAIENIENAKLKVQGMIDEDTKDELVSIESQIGLSTSILMDFGFLEGIASKFGTKKLAIAIINSGNVFISKIGSSFENRFEKMALENQYTDVVNIHSALYNWEVGSNEFKMVKLYKE